MDLNSGSHHQQRSATATHTETIESNEGPKSLCVKERWMDKQMEEQGTMAGETAIDLVMVVEAGEFSRNVICKVN